jgi:hypothetical protein
MVAECINRGTEESTVVSGGNVQMLICIHSVSQIRYLLGSKITEWRFAKRFFVDFIIHMLFLMPFFVTNVLKILMLVMVWVP